MYIYMYTFDVSVCSVCVGGCVTGKSRKLFAFIYVDCNVSTLGETLLCCWRHLLSSSTSTSASASLSQLVLALFNISLFCLGASQSL